MQDNDPVRKGWEFSAKIIGTNAATTMGDVYVSSVEKAIKQLEENIKNCAETHGNLGIDQLQGFMFEEYAAGTFNVDAVAAGSKDCATVLHSNDLNSVDIQLDSGKQYSAKSYKTPEESVKAQAKFNHETGKGSYDGQEKLIAGSDEELRMGKDSANRLANKNSMSRPEVAESYRETADTLTNRIENNEGVSSKPSTRQENAQIAKEAKEKDFKAEKHGVTTQSSIKPEYILKQALKAGYTAAAISAVTMLAPEIYKAIDYLIKTGELDPKDILRLGEKGITAGAEGFLRGSVSSSLCILCESGKLGTAFKDISPSLLGTITVLAMQTIKNSILVAAGKMTPQQMGEAFIDTVVVSTGFLIGGAVSQALFAQAPVFGFLLGSLVGTAFSVVYNIGKKKLISLCVDSGFTCFGLVEQDYQLPEEFLNSMGISTIKINRTQIHHAKISTVSISQTSINRSNYETIGFVMPRRGLIGVNKIGYIV